MAGNLAAGRARAVSIRQGAVSGARRLASRLRHDLVGRFAVLAALVLGATGVVLAVQVSDSLERRLIAEAETESVALAENASAMLRLLDATPTDVDDPVVGRIVEAMRPQLERLGPVGVVIWNREHEAVLASHADDGNQPSDERGAVITRTLERDQPHSRVVASDAASPAKAPGERWLETFTPVRLPAGDPVVLQVTRDYAPIAARIDGAQLRTALTVAGAGLGLLALLLPVLVGARRRLAAQSQRLEGLLATEQETVGELRRLHTMKDTLLTAVSHELRTPLTVVRGTAATLASRLDELDDEQLRLLVTSLDTQSQRLDQLLGDLLDVDRLSRGVLEPHRQDLDATALVRNVAERAEVSTNLLQLPTAPVSARLDPGWLERIVENLLANAARHAPPETPIRVELDRTDAGLRLAVADRGPGIPHHERHRIFEPFHRLDTTDPAPGAGLGLTLVARLAELHGGAAWVDEDHTHGARIVVWLPDAPHSGTPGPSPAGSEESAPTARV